ncbi:hypothetical protein M0R19_02425 [Candidatus Pacearchaeota archaeon]|nr:hypothetical protein [Candidatus Pacearchaeota archaeon]
MQQIYQLLLGIILLLLGIPIGNILAKMTKEELKPGRIWFKTILILSSIGAIIFLVLKNDALLFILLFIAVVTSRSLKNKK